MATGAVVHGATGTAARDTFSGQRQVLERRDSVYALEGSLVNTIRRRPRPPRRSPVSATRPVGGPHTATGDRPAGRELAQSS